MAGPRFTMVVLLVEDLARSLAFYRHLGMVFPPDADRRRDLQLDIGDGRQFVWTTTFVGNVPDHRPASGGSRIILEFFVEDRGNVDAMFDELTSAGYPGRRAPFLTDFGAYMCLVDD